MGEFVVIKGQRFFKVIVKIYILVAKSYNQVHSPCEQAQYISKNVHDNVS